MKKVTFNELKVKEKSATCMIKNARLQWVSLAQPNTRYGEKNEHGEPITGTYEVTLLIPKKDFKSIEAGLKKTVEQLIEGTNVYKNAKEKATALKTATKWGEEGALIKDGDNVIKEETGLPYPGNEDNYLMRVKTKAVKKNGEFSTIKYPIQMVRADRSPIRKDEITEEFYSGVFANVVFNLSPSNTPTFKGVTAYLSSVQKVADGDPLGGGGYFSDESSEEDDLSDE